MTFRISLLCLLFAAPVAAQDGWMTHVDMSGNYQIDYPPSWQVLSKGNAVVITSPGEPHERGVFGITPRAAGLSINEAVAKEFEDPNRPADLAKGPARIGGIPAVKVWGSSKKDPNIRVVQYYVQKGDIQYYILFQAPHSAMNRYSAVFNKMIGTMMFLK